MKTTRILIVEDDILFRELLRRVLSREPRIKVVGEADNGETAFRIAKEIKPDVVLMDIELKGDIDGIEVALQIKKERPETGIVILSAHGEWRYVSSLPLRSSRGWAYLLKKTVPDLDTVLRAIEVAKTGRVMLDPEVVRVMRTGSGSLIGKLSPSKREVLKLIAQGYSNAAVAKRLQLSTKSVENYINIIYQELNLSSESAIHARVKATLMYLDSNDV